MSLSFGDRKLAPELQVVLEQMYDHGAADRATPEEARQRLRVIKHYVRAAFGDTDINLNVKNFIKMFGLSCEMPFSVVGGYNFLVLILKTLHKCEGRPCVLKLKKKALPESLKLALKRKASVRKAKTKGDGAPSSKTKKPSSKSKVPTKKNGTNSEMKKIERRKQRDVHKGKGRLLKSIPVSKTENLSSSTSKDFPGKVNTRQYIESKGPKNHYRLKVIKQLNY